MIRNLLLPAVLAVAPLAQVARAQAVVYDNTSTYQGSEHEILPAGDIDALEQGNRIHLSGTQRTVTGLDFVLRIGDFGPATFDARVRIYSADGPGGGPGALLWESDPRSLIIDSGAPLQYGVDVPSVLVPDTIIWTVELSNRSGNPNTMGSALHAPPVVGSADPGVWCRVGPGPLGWLHVDLGVDPYGARVEAVGQPPAVVPTLPASWTVAFVGLLAATGWVALRRRRIAV